MSAAPLSLAKCHYCSRFKLCSEVVNFGESMVRCFECQEKHDKALEAYSTGIPPDKCGECGISFDDLAKLQLGEKASMFLHWKDGLYQLLCPRCDANYVQKRKDLFGPTRFGYARKLS